RQLSSLAPKILGWRRPGKIGNADTMKRTVERLSAFLYAQKLVAPIFLRTVQASSPRLLTQKLGVFSFAKGMLNLEKPTM
ncbi:MAG: hypothetical protein K2P49_09740, partial [Oscillospiraceae bacterium]|nr:hypothetical protein [Oscillospiraceae bacterium]